MASWYDRYRQFAQAQWEPTVLSSQEEAAFREWLIKSKWFQQIRDDVAASGERVDDAALYEELTGPRADYDYRGAWKAGVGAQDYEFDDRMHWPSSTADGRMLKSPKHPTAWVEYFMQDTGVDPKILVGPADGGRGIRVQPKSAAERPAVKLPTLEEFFVAHGILTRQPRVVRPFHRRIFQSVTQWVAGTLARRGPGNLAICIPPRHGKTYIARDLVSWGLMCFPDSEWIYTASSATLAIAQTLAIKECCASDWYRRIAPYVGVQSGKGRQDYFRTTVGGAVYGVGAEGALTGFGAGRKRPEFGGGIVIDDPIHGADALTSTGRSATSGTRKPCTRAGTPRTRPSCSSCSGCMKKTSWGMCVRPRAASGISFPFRWLMATERCFGQRRSNTGRWNA